MRTAALQTLVDVIEGETGLGAGDGDRAFIGHTALPPFPVVSEPVPLDPAAVLGDYKVRLECGNLPVRSYLLAPVYLLGARGGYLDYQARSVLIECSVTGFVVTAYHHHVGIIEGVFGGS